MPQLKLYYSIKYEILAGGMVMVQLLKAAFSPQKYNMRGVSPFVK